MRRFLASLSIAAVGLSSFAMPALAQVLPPPGGRSADLSIVKTGPSTISFGNAAVYTLKIANAGPIKALKIVVKDIVPTDTVFVPAASSTECTPAGPYVACTLDSLRPGATHKFTVAFKPTLKECKPITFVNRAQVKSAVTPDPDETNNESNKVQTSLICARRPQCSDRIDNDMDGKVDYPADPGCTSTLDNDEYNAPLPPQCSDGLDNDMDGAKDYPNDFSCSSLTDNDETNPKAACQDGVDNDGDSKIDMQDAGCADNQDNDESNAATAEEEFVITVKSIGSADSVVRNQKNVNLLRFEGHAVNEDVLFTSAAFNARMGNILNGQNYRLWVDTDYNGAVDTILQDSTLPSGGIITFNTMFGGGYVIPATKSVVFEVHSDIAGSLSDPKTLQLQFATAQADYVQAERLTSGSNLVGIRTNGICAGACEITVNTVPSILLTIKDQGDLFVRQSVTPIRLRQLLGGTLESEILALDFRAEHEDVEVTDLQITSSGSRAVSVDRLELYFAGATTPFATATVGGCGSDDVLTQWQGVAVQTFCSNMESRQLVIPRNGETRVIVRPRMKTDEEGAIAGERVRLFIWKRPISNNATGAGAVRARGGISSNNLSANDEDTVAEGEVFIGTYAPAPNTDIVGRKNVVTLAEYNAIANANPDPNGTNVPTGPASPFGQFRFGSPVNNNTMNGINKAVLNDVIFNVNAANVAMNAADFKFYNKTDSSSKATCVAKNFAGVILTGEINGTFVVECANLTSTTVDTENFSGEQSTFVLEGNITNPKIVSSATSVLQASLQNFGTNGADIPTVYGIADQHIRWLDRDIASFTHVWIEYPDTVVNSTSYQS